MATGYMKKQIFAFTHSFLYKATALKPPHHDIGVEVEPRRCREFIPAFTLIELLVVLSIMAMLLSILMPVMASAKRTSYRTMCKENLHGCALGFQMYMNDYKNVMPAAMFMPSIPSSTEITNNIKPIATVLAKYLSGPAALKCPADKKPDNTASSYFTTEGSSYKYNTSLAGQTIDKNWMAKRFGLQEVWMMSDYYGFHGRIKSDGTWPPYAYMYLFADTMVADRERSK
jgi:prepilin-type N-terminal cleavage/methylation domain-containing protein